MAQLEVTGRSTVGTGAKMIYSLRLAENVSIGVEEIAWFVEEYITTLDLLGDLLGSVLAPG